MRATTRGPLVAAAAVLAVSTLATATPKNLTVTSVYKALPCGSSPCPDGTPKIKSGSVVTEPIQIHVHAEDPLGLQAVRLEARFEGHPEWLCVQQWDRRSQTQTDDWYSWDIRYWPEPSEGWGCTETSPHFHGEPTQNAKYELRVYAANYLRPNDDNATGDPFVIYISQPPIPPVWAGDPTVALGEDSANVTLSWVPNKELDVSEYRYVRLDPRGNDAEFAINAASPENQGCSTIGDQMIRCIDHPPQSGEYLYALFALRKGASGEKVCSFAKGDCVESGPSTQKLVAVDFRNSQPQTQNNSAPPPIASQMQPDTSPAAGQQFAVEGEDRREQLAAAENDPLSENASPNIMASAYAITILLLGIFAFRKFSEWRKARAE